MSGMQRILANNRNQIKSAVLSASGVAASSRVYLRSATRGGSGSVALSGLYSGAADAGFDVQIVDTTGNGRVSLPVFRGQGSGVLSNITPGTLPQQQITITLADMGIMTTAAEIEFYGVTLRAVAAGAAGNNITISVDESALVDTIGKLSTFDQINADTDTLIGPQYDFGAVSLATGGTLPADAPRLRFVGDPQIYRQYKKFSSNQWEYHLVPKPPRVIAKSTAVAVVSGAYSVTITDGVTSETYSVTTLYDFLAALQASALITVIGAVVKDLTPGGMATLDLPVKTAAYHLGITSTRIKTLADIAVKPSAPTELLNITCIDDSALGAEVWKVEGSASGILPQARTGVPYTDPTAPVGFTVPKWLPEITTSVAAGPTVILIGSNYATRATTETEPEILIKGGQVGIAGKPTSITATYKKALKTVDCNADEAVLAGYISRTCLGLDDTTTITGGGAMAMDPEYQSRLIDLYGWQRTFIDTNAVLTKLATADGTVSKIMEYKFDGVNWAYTHIDYVNNAAGLASRGSVSGSAWLGSSPVSDQVVWAHDFPTAVTGDYAGLITILALPAIDTLMDLNDIRLCNTITQLLADSLALVAGIQAGRTAWDTFYTSVKATLVDLNTLKMFAAAPDEYLSGFRAGVNLVLASAGIVPGKSEGSAVSTGCWTSQDGDYWEIPGYAPAYTNTAYLSTKFSSDGTPYSTKEFGFFIACKCPQFLKYGDSVTIGINGGSESSKTWQVGDLLTIPLIAATPLTLSGGQNGNDTVTWKVRGMVSGALPDFSVVLNTPAPYLHVASGFGFSLALGGIPFALGDAFSLAIEGGNFKWRTNAGAWSASLPIADTSLSDGLSAVFAPGAFPSFAPGDFFSFVAQQPAAPGNIAATDIAGWSFSADSATLLATWAVPVALDAVGLARIQPNVAAAAVTTTLEYSLDGSTAWTALAAPVIGRTVRTLQLDAPLSIMGLRLTVACPGGATVGWLWAGSALSTDYAPDVIKMRRAFDMIHGVKDCALNIGEAWAGDVAWSMMSQSDFDNHLAVIEDCKRDNDAPVIFIPHHMHPEEGVLVRIQSDSVDIVDEFQFHPDDSSNRLLALTMPLAPVWR